MFRSIPLKGRTQTLADTKKGLHNYICKFCFMNREISERKLEEVYVASGRERGSREE